MEAWDALVRRGSVDSARHLRSRQLSTAEAEGPIR